MIKSCKIVFLGSGDSQRSHVGYCLNINNVSVEISTKLICDISKINERKICGVCSHTLAKTASCVSPDCMSEIVINIAFFLYSKKF